MDELGPAPSELRKKEGGPDACGCTGIERSREIMEGAAQEPTSSGIEDMGFSFSLLGI